VQATQFDTSMAVGDIIRFAGYTGDICCRVYFEAKRGKLYAVVSKNKTPLRIIFFPAVAV
jgi:hypothetical protein